MNLFMMEIHRSLTRRAVRVLIAVAVFGCLVAGVIAMIGSNGKTLDQLRFEGEGHPAVMTDWWDAGTNDGFLAIGTFLLLMGGLFGGATVAGAEWRAGTVTTLLTWEPRRIATTRGSAREQRIARLHHLGAAPGVVPRLVHAGGAPQRNDGGGRP